MDALKLVSNYRDNERYRISFNRLTEAVFNFNLEEWYEKGFWCDRYIPYSLVDGDKVVSNVSVSKMDLLVGGARKKAIQIGTVMTHPDYRGNGLASRLIRMILKEYEQVYDLFYLFAGKSAGGFYSRFGFSVTAENLFAARIEEFTDSGCVEACKLNLSDPDVMNDVYRMLSARAPVSRVFGVANAHNLAMFHCLYGFADCLYHVETEGVLAACQQRNETLHVYDLISAHSFDTGRVIRAVAGKGVKKAVFYFTPDMLDLDTTIETLISDDLFMVKGDLPVEGSNYKYPLSAMA